METYKSLRDMEKDYPAAQHFVIAAVSRYKKHGGTEHIEMPLQVTLAANGVEIPFAETIADIYDRIHKQAREGVDAQSLVLAKQMALTLPLSSFTEAIERAYADIEHAVEQHLNRAPELMKESGMTQAVTERFDAIVAAWDNTRKVLEETLAAVYTLDQAQPARDAIASMDKALNTAIPFRSVGAAAAPAEA